MQNILIFVDMPGKEHPGTVLESSTLSMISPPPLKYTLNNNILGLATVSKVQLEGIARICARHEEILKSGFRAGFLLGKSKYNAEFDYSLLF